VVSPAQAHLTAAQAVAAVEQTVSLRQHIVTEYVKITDQFPDVLSAASPALAAPVWAVEFTGMRFLADQGYQGQPSTASGRPAPSPRYYTGRLFIVDDQRGTVTLALACP
jgi:hypothetical protein